MLCIPIQKGTLVFMLHKEESETIYNDNKDHITNYGMFKAYKTTSS